MLTIIKVMYFKGYVLLQEGHWKTLRVWYKTWRCVLWCEVGWPNIIWFRKCLLHTTKTANKKVFDAQVSGNMLQFLRKLDESKVLYLWFINMWPKFSPIISALVIFVSHKYKIMFSRDNSFDSWCFCKDHALPMPLWLAL